MSKYKHEIQNWNTEDCVPSPSFNYDIKDIPKEMIEEIANKEVAIKRINNTIQCIIAKDFSILIPKEITTSDPGKPITLLALAQLHQKLKKELTETRLELYRTQENINLDEQFSDISMQLENLSRAHSKVSQEVTRKTDKITEEGQSLGKEPSPFDRFLADTKPNLFKSFIKFFIPNDTILSSQAKCKAYDDYKKKIEDTRREVNNLTGQLNQLTTTKTTTERRKVDIGEKLLAQNSIREDIRNLKTYIKSLEINLATLLDAKEKDDIKKELATALSSVGEKTQAVAEDNLEDNDFYFKMDIY